MAAVLPTLSVTITQRGWACVLDLTLALSALDLLLARLPQLNLDFHKDQIF